MARYVSGFPIAWPSITKIMEIVPLHRKVAIRLFFRYLLITLVQFLWYLRDLFFWADLIIQQLSLCVHHRSDSARGQRYNQ